MFFIYFIIKFDKITPAIHYFLILLFVNILNWFKTENSLLLAKPAPIKDRWSSIFIIYFIINEGNFKGLKNGVLG